MSGGALYTPLHAVRLQQLAYLDAVARTGHFGEAAEALSVSQPALSQGLIRLERAVGSDLFRTDGRRRVLTSTGHEVARYAARVLAQTRRLDDRLRARAAGRAGSLNVGMVDAAALYLVADEIEDYRRRHPDVELHIHVDSSGPLLEAVDTHALDLVLVIGPVEGRRSLEIRSEPLNVYGPPVDDLASAERWVLYPEGSKTRAVLDRAFAELGLRPTVEAQSANPSVIAQLVRLGGLWTVLPPGIAEAGPDPLPRVGRPLGDRHLVAVWPDQADPLVDGFVDAMRPG